MNTIYLPLYSDRNNTVYSLLIEIILYIHNQVLMRGMVRPKIL